jgi:ribosome biogenesis GTPase A
MSKTIRELKELTKRVDTFFVLLDARAPKSSFVDSIKEIIKDKNYIIVLTKSDLVNKEDLEK